MSISNELTRIQNAKADIVSAIVEKGGSVSSGARIDAFPSAIRAIPTGGGGDHDAEDGIIMRTISGAYENSRVTSIGYYAFASCQSLTTASFPACTYIGTSAFASCRSLTTALFPACTSTDSNVFYSCASLTTASFPACTYIGTNAFRSCASLTTASFPACTYIGSSAFASCRRLLALYLTGGSICTLTHSNAFNTTPIAGYIASTGGVYGSIFVPMSLLSTYQAATNWTYFSSRFVGVNPEDM